MGKASKWIMNFLVGKKDQEKNKKKSDVSSSSSSFSLERKVVNNNSMSITTITTTTPKVKRRWSFGRSSAPPTTGTGTGTETPPTHRRTNLSFDSFVTRQLLTKALLDGKYEQNLQNRLVARNAAATRIQAAFRSFLARKALGALKGLVKIQALVRGHLVRKQTTSMLRSMNALMAIQIRARFHRIQKSEESQQLVVEKQTSHGDSRNYLKSKSANQNIEPKTKRTEDRIITYNSSSLSVSKRDHQFQITYPNSPYTDTTPRIYSFDAFLYNNNATKESPHNGTKTDQIGYEDTPSYMANTESFRAKVRSQSEPKRRPVTQKNRRTTSSDMRTVTPDNQTRGSSPVLRDNGMKNQHPWLIKLYRSSKSVKDIECDSRSSMMTNEEDYRRSLIAYEPSVNLY